MVFIHLSEEEKLQVLLLAFAFFLTALVVSICLALTICPLNRWLLERNAKRRFRNSAFSSQLNLISNVRQANGLIRSSQQKGGQSLASYAGPPPAYEAALRATRLQSLTGSLPPINHPHPHPHAHQLESDGTNEKQLDFGDYFHQAREPPVGIEQACPHAHIHIPMAALGEPLDKSRQPPIMLRLWVRMLDPGELVARSRAPPGCGGGGGFASTNERHQEEGRRASGQRLSLSRQLSIPQFIGSLVNLATGKPALAQLQPIEISGSSGGGGGGQTAKLQEQPGATANSDFSSLMSNETTSSSSSGATTTASNTSGGSLSPTAPVDVAAALSSCKLAAGDQAGQLQAADERKWPASLVGATDRIDGQRDPPKKLPSPPPAQQQQQQQQQQHPQHPQGPFSQGSQGSFLANNSITSRVLHMNVASFSYVKDESLISAKQHQQQNQLHFYDSPPHFYGSGGGGSLERKPNTGCPTNAAPSTKKNGSNSSGSGNSNNNKTKDKSKLCQLVISVCDIENLLNSSWLNERSCALLTNNSAIYIQCEILAPKSKSARLLRLPLKAAALGGGSSGLNGLSAAADHASSTSSCSSPSLGGVSSGSSASSVVGTTVSSARAHTVNFSSVISAAAVERPPSVIPPAGWLDHSALAASCGGGANHALHMLGCPPNADSGADLSSSLSLSDQQPQSLITTTQPQQQQEFCAPNPKKQQQQGSLAESTNWRHEPAADGRSIVVFNSVPKQVAHQQELAAASAGPAGSIQPGRLDCCCPACQALVAGAPELIQFDSVFVSPILSKSIIENGYVRFRVYSQCKYVNETCLAELKLPLKQLLLSESRDNLGDASAGFLAPPQATDYQAQQQQQQQQQRIQHFQQQADYILNNLLANLVTASTGLPLSSLIEQVWAEQERIMAAAAAANNGGQHEQQQQQQQRQQEPGAFRLPWPLSNAVGGNNAIGGQLASGPTGAQATGASNELSSDRQQQQQRQRRQQQQIFDGLAANYNSKSGAPLKSSCSLNESLYRLSSLREELQQQQQQEELEQQQQQQREEEAGEAAAAAELERRIEQNYCRSLMVSHWLNYLVAPAYECQLVEEARGKVILALSYLPTSNRVIFNAHKAIIDQDSFVAGKQLMKNLRFQASTCYLLRFLMVLDGRVVKRKQTPVCKKPEWDSQEPITFDLVSLSKEQPSFVVALVMRNSNLGTGSLQNLRPQCNCNNNNNNNNNNSSANFFRPTVAPSRAQHKTTNCGVQSEPESLHHPPAHLMDGRGIGGGGIGLMHNHTCALYRASSGSMSQRGVAPSSASERDLVIGHLVLSDNIWREMRAQPRKQIVKQFKIY